MKKILSIVLALAMILMVAAASAATITIDRADNWDEDAANANATYTWYKIFDAVITTAAEVNHDTGELKSDDGNVVYTISGTDADAKVAVLPGIFKAEKSAGDGKYYISLTDESTTATAIVNALDTMITANPDLFAHNSVTSDKDPVVIDELDTGYYFIKASNGNKLAAQTIGTVNIKEKNDYPTIDKTEKDPEIQGDQYSDGPENLSVGDQVEYQVVVTVPATTNADIVVKDTMSTGLAYDASTMQITCMNALTEGTDYIKETPGSGETWKYTIKPTAKTVGYTVTFTFKATITKDAIVNVKKNDVDLTYGNYHLTDTVSYKLYKTAAYKYDGADYTEELKNVEFTLKEGTAEFKVSQHADGYYYPDTEGSATVTTNNDGLIIIRGLDKDKTYTLTETKNPNPGYNMVKDPVTLTLIEDTATDSTAYVPTVGTQLAEKGEEVSAIANNKGTELPSTGGIGTTIFYVVGGILLIGAAIILVSRRRAHN